MKKSTTATSIVESMVILMIVVLGVVGMYTVFSSSQKLAAATKYRIEAISIAREGIEAFTNIRDTNALLFTSDLENCWNTLNYDTRCIGDTSETYDIGNGKSFILFQDSDNKWKLTEKSVASGTGYFSPNYINNFIVKKDINGFYTQSGGVDIFPKYTRELKINYIDSVTGLPSITSNTDKMKISSIVQWVDTSSKKVYEMELNTLLTNWRRRD